jgi:hypothetical protein
LNEQWSFEKPNQKYAVWQGPLIGGKNEAGGAWHLLAAQNEATAEKILWRESLAPSVHAPAPPYLLPAAASSPQPQLLAFSHRLSTIAMAASNGAAAADSIQETPQKISKIAPLLKVKKLSDKAVLPSRGSALAAGYDLSRYALYRRANVQDALYSRLPNVA